LKRLEEEKVRLTKVVRGKDDVAGGNTEMEMLQNDARVRATGQKVDGSPANIPVKTMKKSFFFKDKDSRG